MRKLSGVRTPHHKGTWDKPSVLLPVPPEVVIPMSMHIGAPAKPAVAEKDTVKVGQVIGEAQGFVSSLIHSSVSGTVKSIQEITGLTGAKTLAVRIAADGEQAVFEGLSKPSAANRDEFLAAVRNSGAVGLGGAGFPTDVKLKVGDKLDYLIINGAECEPYVTSDTRTMIEEAGDVWKGILLLKEYINAENTVIGIEANKPEAIEKMRELCGGAQGVAVHMLPSKYPQGGEKVLIYGVTGRAVPEGKLPLDVGVVVINCTTLAHIAKYFETGMPLVTKRVTVDGTAVRSPGNVIAPIGTPVSALFDFCGGFVEEPKKILLGGPMMGIAIPDTDMPVTKTTNAALAFGRKEAEQTAETACIRCGRCVMSCPMKLMPLEVDTAYNLNKPERLEKLRANLCMECGCCAYSCPAKRPLTQVMKLSKQALGNYMKTKAKGGEATK